MCHVSQYEHFELLNRHVSHGPSIKVRVRVRVRVKAKVPVLGLGLGLGLGSYY
jgi:hypothetical protein